MVINNKNGRPFSDKKEGKVEASFINSKKQEQASYPIKGREEATPVGDLMSKKRILESKTMISTNKSKFRKAPVKVGDICDLKISAVGPNNIGMDEFSFSYPVFVPNANLFYGSKIKAKMVKIVSSTQGSSTIKQVNSYAVAQLEVKESKSKTGVSPENDSFKNVPVKAGEVLTVSIKKKGSLGIVELENNFRLIVPLSSPLTSYENIKVRVTRLKKEYGFASLLVELPKKQGSTNLVPSKKLNIGTKFTTTLPLNGKIFGKYLLFKTCYFGENTILFVKLEKGVRLGDKVRIKITSTSSAGAALPLVEGSPSGQGISSAIGKILQLPATSTTNQGNILAVSKIQKASLVMKSIREMVSHGMHFGEKALKCHARMKNFIWLKPDKTSLRSSNMGSPAIKNSISSKLIASDQQKNTFLLGNEPYEKTQFLLSQQITDRLSKGSSESALTEIGFSPFISSQKKELIFSGQQPMVLDSASQSTSFVIPKRPLIKKGRHVINLLKTRRCLNKALKKLSKYALKGRTFLFIGTKKPASGLVARASFFTQNSFYVNTRWLGGMLTNWKAICKSISKIRPILKEKQKVVREILERRQIIKSRLIKKALLLRKKSKLILTKGCYLVEALKKVNQDNNTYNNAVSPSLAKINGVNGNYTSSPQGIVNSQAKKEPIQESAVLTLLGMVQGSATTNNYMTLRDEFVSRGRNLLEKRQKFIKKRRELILQTHLLKEKGLKISFKQQALFNQLAIYTKKLRDYKYLLILTSEIHGQSSLAQPSSNLVSVSYNKLKEISLGGSTAAMSSSLPNQSSGTPWIIPNPPKEILNKIVLTMKNQSKSESALWEKQSVNGIHVQSENNPIIVCSTLLSKFGRFSLYVQSVIKQLMSYIQVLEAQSQSYSIELNQIQSTLKTYLSFKEKYVAELQQFKIKLTNERSIIRIVKRQLKALDAQKKLIKFLPRLRFLPTPQTKISEIVQILLSKIVDPKFKYPIENIYDQKLSNTSKKLAAARKKKWQRLEKYFGGIANMTKLTKSQISRNVAIIIGQKEEMNAVRECQKLGIKMFTIVDTNCNPTLSDHIIPANDDSRSSIKYILAKFITRIRLAQKLRSRLQKLNLPLGLKSQKKVSFMNNARPFGKGVRSPF